MAGELGGRTQTCATKSATQLKNLGPFFCGGPCCRRNFQAEPRDFARPRYLACDGFSLWSGESSPQWDALEDGPELTGTSLPPFHVAGVGAVGNGLAYVIANAGFADAYPALIDDDKYDDTSLNRCVLAGWEDRHQPKVNVVERTLASRRYRLFSLRRQP